jgi:dimethylargininase
MRVFDFDMALVRAPGASVVHGLRHGNGPSPVFDEVCREHAVYVAALEESGLDVQVLPAIEDFPDGLFVEDPALVFPEGAILLRPGTMTRAAEAQTLRPVLETHFGAVTEITAGHVDGGDVLVTPDLVVIGLSQRTDRRGAKALSDALDRLGRRSRVVMPPPGVLHLKTAVTLIDEETILTTQACEESGLFTRFRQLIVPDSEPAAANALRINERLLVGDQFVRTNEMLDREGYRLLPLPIEHIGRIDAGLTCLSLRWMRQRSLH